MQRPLKFRAWGGYDEDGAVRYFVYFTLNDVEEGHIKETEPEEPGSYKIHQKENVLDIQQFTGLHDKNGKEIYEGDVVVHRELGSEIDYATFGIFETAEGHKPRVVKYEAYGFSPIAGWIEDVHEKLQWEVIGNIYENPELLDHA